MRPILLLVASLLPAQDFLRIQDLEVSRTETTVAQFRSFVAKTRYLTQAERDASPRTWRTPGFRLDQRQPVVLVTPSDAQAFCASLGARLPTSEEWLSFASAGSTTRHYWGETLDPSHLWYRDNSRGRPGPTGRKLPNPLGLFDVEGNVWEWTLNPDGTASRRGGSWTSCESIDGAKGKSPLIGLKVSFGIPGNTTHRSDDIGFRCVR